MQVKPTNLDSVVIIEPRRFGDARGYFSETYNRREFSKIGVDLEFVQDNHSRSEQAGTLRGLHFQNPPAAQAKLMRCVSGAIFDVAIDIRVGSPTYGDWTGHELSAENGLQLYVPVGFAHGFMTLTPDTEVLYKCSDFYAPDTEGSIRWNDPDIGIDWPLSGRPPLSDKDAEAPSFCDLRSPFKFEAEQ